MSRQIKYVEAIREATELALAEDPRVIVIGEGVPDPKGIFGTTLGLQEKFGPERVLDMPLSEDGMTGVAIGAALNGLRPILTHQRLDFALLSMNQIVNNAAKWHYMFSGQQPVPLVIRMVVGMGWGQGAQHAQALHAWFAHVPGLKVVLPATPADAKGLLLASIADENPVIFIEHRWLHNTFGEVAEGQFTVLPGRGRVARPGEDITIVAVSYMLIEALRAAEKLQAMGVSAEVIDIRTARPLDFELIQSSVKKTRRLLVADIGWRFNGLAAEIITAITESCFKALAAPPQRIALPDYPTPTSPALTKRYYPRAGEIARTVCRMLELTSAEIAEGCDIESVPHDVPDPNFTGPF